MDDHICLIGILKAPLCMVMISGYGSQLYADALGGWNRTCFQTMTRGGRRATEWLWYNDPGLVALHDWRYLGLPG